MSATIPPTVVVPTVPLPLAIAPEVHKAQLTNGVVKVAQDMPELVSLLQTVNPALAQQIEGKALVASKSPWGTLAGSAVGFLAAKYGLTCTAATLAAGNCWTPETVNLIGGGAAMLGAFVASYLMRSVTIAPITGLFKKAPPPGSVTTTAVTTPSAVVTTGTVV